MSSLISSCLSSLQIRAEKPYYLADPEVDSLVSAAAYISVASARIIRVHFYTVHPLIPKWKIYGISALGIEGGLIAPVSK